MDLADRIYEQMSGLNRVLRTKEELMDFYKQEYGRNWNNKLSRALQPLIPRTKSGKLQSITNIERRHQSRGGKGIPGMTKATSAQYKQLGELIGAVPPASGYRVTWHGEIKISDNCWPRAFGPLLIEGEDARRLAATGDPFIILRTYFQGEDMAEGWCGSPDVTIEAASDNQQQMTFAHGPQGSKLAGILKK